MRAGYAVQTAEDGRKAIQILEKTYFDLVVSDLKMPGMDGLDLLSQIKKTWPATEVIIITGFGTIPKGVEAVRMGAFDFISKPFENNDFLNIINRLVENHHYAKTKSTERDNVRNNPEFDAIISESEKMYTLMRLTKRIAPKETSCILYGESGTGKELIAMSIHALGKRKHRPFLSTTCGGVDQNFLERELFGHAEGVFSDSNYEKEGLFEAANGGTAFIGEIDEMPASTQIKLLRCLQENEIRRIGENFVRGVEFRLIVASNINLEKAVAVGRFREDLFYRINIVPINVPPLRERREDIPLLVEHFINKYAQRDESKASSVSKRALSMLINYDWPGNVRELENVIDRCVALTLNDEISPDLLPPGIHARPSDNNRTSNKKRNSRQIERKVILETLHRLDGSKKKTAEELGISKTTLWRKLKT